MNLTLEVADDGTWIIGRRTAEPCPWCGAKPIARKAENGRAVLWHTPTACCKDAIGRSIGAPPETPKDDPADPDLFG